MKNSEKLTSAQQKVIDYLERGCRIYYNIQGSDPVFENGVLIDRIANIGTIANLISNGLIREENYEYKLNPRPALN